MHSQHYQQTFRLVPPPSIPLQTIYQARAQQAAVFGFAPHPMYVVMSPTGIPTLTTAPSLPYVPPSSSSLRQSSPTTTATAAELEALELLSNGLGRVSDRKKRSFEDTNINNTHGTSDSKKIKSN
jgi:hypothetical protein